MIEMARASEVSTVIATMMSANVTTRRLMKRSLYAYASGRVAEVRDRLRQPGATRSTMPST